MVDLHDLLARFLSDDAQELARGPDAVAKLSPAPAIDLQRKAVEVPEGGVDFRTDGGGDEALQFERANVRASNPSECCGR